MTKVRISFNNGGKVTSTVVPMGTFHPTNSGIRALLELDPESEITVTKPKQNIAVTYQIEP